MPKVMTYLVVSAALTLGAGAASAFKINLDPVKALKDQARKEEQKKKNEARAARRALDDARRTIQEGGRALPRSFGKNPEREAESIKRAEAKLAEGKKALEGPAGMADGRENVVSLAEKLEINIGQAKLAHACSATRDVVVKKHDKTQVASDKELKAFKNAVDTFDEGKVKGWEKTVEWFREEHARVVKNNPVVRERAEAREAKAARREASKKLKSAMQTANAKRRSLTQHMAKGDALTDEMIAEFDEALASVREQNEKAALFYEGEKKYLLVDNAFHANKPKAAYKAVAEIFEGQLVKSGRTKGKKMKFSFQAKKDHCYTALLRWDQHTGSEKIDDLEVNARGGNTPLQHYSLYRDGEKHQRVRGVCATRSARVSFSSKLSFAGTKNGVHYTVVGWPKKSFPAFHATYLRVFTTDRCDTQNWYSLWTNPIPGSIVYRGKEPFLVSSPDRAGQSWVTLTNVTGKSSVRAQKHNLSSEATGDVAFKTQFSWGGCPRLQNAEHKDSKALAKCHQRVDKRYQRSWDKAQRQKENAVTLGGYKAAQRKIESLRQKDARDRKRQCDPIERRIKKKWEKTMDKIVDRLVDKPASDPLKRAERMAAENEASPRL